MEAKLKRSTQVRCGVLSPALLLLLLLAVSSDKRLRTRSARPALPCSPAATLLPDYDKL